MLYSTRKNPYQPHGKSLGIPKGGGVGGGGEGSLKRNLKGKYEA